MKIHHYLENTATTSHGATGKQLLKYGADVKIKQDMSLATKFMLATVKAYIEKRKELDEEMIKQLEEMQRNAEKAGMN